MILFLLAHIFCSSKVPSYQWHNPQLSNPSPNQDISNEVFTTRQFYSKKGQNVNFYSSTFQSQDLDNDGGAVYTSGNAQINFHNCLFMNCKSSKNGGAVYCKRTSTSSSTFSACTFQNCSAASGGAIYAPSESGNSQCVFKNCDFLDNSATSSKELTITNRKLNEGHGGGGAICISDKNGNMQNCTFKNNKCQNYFGSNIIHLTLSESTRQGTFTYNLCNFYYDDSNSNSSFFTPANLPSAFLIQFTNCHFYNSFLLDTSSQHHIYNTNVERPKLDFSSNNNNCFYSQSNQDPEQLKSEFSNSESHFFSNSDECPDFTPEVDLPLLECPNGQLTLTKNCLIKECRFERISVTGDTLGGAIYADEVQYQIIQCEFIKCETVWYGGAIYSELSSEDFELLIQDCSFTECQSNDNKPMAGAIYSSSTGKKKITITFCEFSSNTAHQENSESYGGAIYLKYENAAISNCKFTDNKAKFGCNLYICPPSSLASDQNVEFLIDNCSFQFADTGGNSSIFIDKDNRDSLNLKITMKKCRIINTFNSENKYHFSGFGHFSNDHFDYSQDNCYVSENHQFPDFSDIWKSMEMEFSRCKDDDEVNTPDQLNCPAASNRLEISKHSLIKDCEFTGFNSQDLNGGAIYSDNYLLEIQSSKFITCTSKSGGAIYARIWPHEEFGITISNCDFETCKSGAGGAIYAETKTGKITIELCSFKDNGMDDPQYGGAIYIQCKDADIKNCIFEGNKGYFGGNINLEPFSYSSPTRIVIDNCSFQFIKASQNSIYIDRTNDKDSNSIIIMQNSRIIHTFTSDNQYHFEGNLDNRIDFDYNNCYESIGDENTPISENSPNINKGFNRKCSEEAPPDAPPLPSDFGQCNNQRSVIASTSSKHPDFTNCFYNNPTQSTTTDNGEAISITARISISCINARFHDCHATNCGGAVYISSASASTTGLITFNNSIFDSCTALTGGALYCYTTATKNYQIEFKGCQFYRNEATSNSDTTTSNKNGGGGALYISFVSCKIEECVFNRNKAYRGSNILFFGVGDIPTSQTLPVSSCQFWFEPTGLGNQESSIYMGKGNFRMSYTFTGNTFIGDADGENSFHFFSLNQYSSNPAKIEISFDETNCLRSNSDKYYNDDFIGHEPNLQKCISEAPDSPSDDEGGNDSNSSDSTSDDEGGNDSNSSDSTSDDEGGNDSNSSDSTSDDEGPEEGGKPTNPSGNGDGGNSGNKGFPTYAIGIIVGILVIVLVLIILIVILKKRRMHQNHEEDSHIDDDDKDCEMSMSRVSLESNLDPNEQDADNLNPSTDVEEIDPFKQSFDEFPKHNNHDA